MAYSRNRGSNRSSRPVKIWTRDFIVIILFFAAALYVVGGLVYLQVFKSAEYGQMAKNQQTKTSTLVAKRGTIYDRNGEVLASSVDSKTIEVNPKDIGYDASVSDDEAATMEDPVEAIADIFVEYLSDTSDLNKDDFEELLTKDSSYVIIQRKVDADVADTIKEKLAEKKLVGVYYEEDSTRVYPNGSTGSQVIGTVGLKLVDQSGNVVDETKTKSTEGLSESYRGTSGLELQYDDLLSGTDGSISQQESNSGVPIAGGSVTMKAAENGEDIITSIDIKLQRKAEKTLVKALKKYKAKGGSVTVMDASTGEIYAACSYSKSSSSKGTTYTQDAGKLWSVSDSYEPGSTFKTMTAVSVMANGGVTANSTFEVPSQLKVYDSVVNDSHEHGAMTMTFKEIIAESSNIGTVKASRTVSTSTLYRTYHRFGFGEDCGIDFPGVATGLLEKAKNWNGVQAANVTFGQGVMVSAMQLIRAYGALEQDGVEHVPHFLKEIPNNEELSESETKALKKTKRICKKKTANKVTKLLRSVVKNGTGTAAAIEGYKVVGKTGTAEIASSSGGYLKEKYIVSFAGWIENSDCDLVCLVTMDRAQTLEGGGPVCGPVFADIMSFAADSYQVGTMGDN